MDVFWDSSWTSIDEERVKEYQKRCGTEADNFIKLFREHGAESVCDAGCGCGVLTEKLAAALFHVSAFDISEHAVEAAHRLLSAAHRQAELKTASILETGYEDECFDGVAARDVLDHMYRSEAVGAVRELLRITKPGGIVLFTFDALDDEYRAEPHTVNSDGDYVYTDGKWKGMVFHPYDPETVQDILPPGASAKIYSENGGWMIRLEKKICV